MIINETRRKSKSLPLDDDYNFISLSVQKRRRVEEKGEKGTGRGRFRGVVK